MAQAGKDKKRRGRTVVLDDPPGVGRGDGSQGQACMILIHAPGGEIGRRIALAGDQYVLGREDDADILLDRASASRQHAELKRDARGHWVVTDLDSTNGTFVNERRISALALEDGDQLRFGDVVFKFLSGTNVESKYHEEIYQMSVLDALTGIYNRRYFMDFLEREIASASRHRHPLTLVMLDVDAFKQINDARGHLGGDAVLRQISDRIRGRIRREDLFARYGGEEFGAILTLTGLEGGLHFAEAVRELVARRPFTFDGEEFTVTMSLGVATTRDEPAITVDELIQRADQRMYEAKRAGRNRVSPEVPPLRTGPLEMDDRE
ncbi:MAG TPA: GGDEF domain-containing protein [Kofleriaceae bacterium]|nr:GGDEF domain-containing protein [Kofleriaceae bacterium]